MTNLARLPALGQRQPPLISPALRRSAQGQTCTDAEGGRFTFLGRHGMRKRPVGASHLLDWPHRNGSHEDHVMAGCQIPSIEGARQRQEWTEFHDRHEGKIELIPGVDCWAWVGSVGKRGHGRVNHGRKVQYAHRLAYKTYHGKEADGLVRHLCGNAACVRPSHLADGSHKDNARDMAVMGTSRSKISPIDAAKIRQRYVDGLPLKDIADEFGIAFGSVYPIVMGKSFKFADGPVVRALRSPRKLTSEDVGEIRSMLAQGCSQASIARKFDVRASLISRIHTGDRHASAGLT